MSQMVLSHLWRIRGKLFSLMTFKWICTNCYTFSYVKNKYVQCYYWKSETIEVLWLIKWIKYQLTLLFSTIICLPWHRTEGWGRNNSVKMGHLFLHCEYEWVYYKQIIWRKHCGFTSSVNMATDNKSCQISIFKLFLN